MKSSTIIGCIALILLVIFGAHEVYRAIAAQDKVMEPLRSQREQTIRDSAWKYDQFVSADQNAMSNEIAGKSLKLVRKNN